MLNFNSFFTQGLKSTLRTKPGTNWSFKGPWVQVFASTELDRWYIGDFSTASYRVVTELDSHIKETVNLLVVATQNTAHIIEYGRIKTGSRIVDFSAEVNDSYVTLLASPASPIMDGAKTMYTVEYSETLTDASPLEIQNLVENNKFDSEYGFQTTGFSVSNGLLSVDNLNADNISAESLTVDDNNGTYLLVTNGLVEINSQNTGTIDNISIGPTTPSTANITDLTVLDNATLSLSGTIIIEPTTTGSINNVNIGISTPGNAQFVTLTATSGTITSFSANNAVITSIISTGTQTLGTVTANNITVSNTVTADTVTADTIVTDTITVDTITADSISLNTDPTIPTHATRKSYVDATIAALSIALGG